MTYSLIDKIQPASAATNIATVGYQTLLCVLKNSAASAPNYTGSEAEAKALLAGTTVKVSDNADGSSPVDLDTQYIKARTIAGTINAVLEIVLTKATVASITLPTNVTRTIDLLTLPSNSKV